MANVVIGMSVTASSASSQSVEVISSSTSSSHDDIHSPLYVYPSDNPGALVVAELFSGENYISWSRSIEMALSVKNKTGFLDVIKEIRQTLMLLSTARDVWLELKARLIGEIMSGSMPVSLTPSKRSPISGLANDGDCISQLLLIICHILSCLTVKEALRTSVLARDWEYKWTCIYKVYINDREAIAQSKESKDGLPLRRYDKLGKLGMSCVNAEGLFELLHAAPFLKTLVVNGRNFYADPNHSDELEYVPPCIVHHLEEISVIYFYGTTNE